MHALAMFLADKRPLDILLLGLLVGLLIAPSLMSLARDIADAWLESRTYRRLSIRWWHIRCRLFGHAYGVTPRGNWCCLCCGRREVHRS